MEMMCLMNGKASQAITSARDAESRTIRLVSPRAWKNNCLRLLPNTFFTPISFGPGDRLGGREVDEIDAGHDNDQEADHRQGHQGAAAGYMIAQTGYTRIKVDLAQRLQTVADLMRPGIAIIFIPQPLQLGLHFFHR